MDESSAGLPRDFYKRAQTVVPGKVYTLRAVPDDSLENAFNAARTRFKPKVKVLKVTGNTVVFTGIEGGASTATNIENFEDKYVTNLNESNALTRMFKQDIQKTGEEPVSSSGLSRDFYKASDFGKYEKVVSFLEKGKYLYNGSILIDKEGTRYEKRGLGSGMNLRVALVNLESGKKKNVTFGDFLKNYFVYKPSKKNIRNESHRAGGIEAYIDPEQGDASQVESDLVPIVLDLGSSRRGELDESFLHMFGSAIQAIMGRMFGGSAVPVKVKGTKSEIDSFAKVLQREKKYLQTWSDLGLDNPATYKSKFKLDTAIKQFERKTGIKYPIK